jgi:hypothetical protein
VHPLVRLPISRKKSSQSSQQNRMTTLKRAVAGGTIPDQSLFLRDLHVRTKTTPMSSFAAIAIRPDVRRSATDTEGGSKAKATSLQLDIYIYIFAGPSFLSELETLYTVLTSTKPFQKDILLSTVLSNPELRPGLSRLLVIAICQTLLEMPEAKSEGGFWNRMSSLFRRRKHRKEPENAVRNGRTSPRANAQIMTALSLPNPSSSVSGNSPQQPARQTCSLTPSTDRSDTATASRAQDPDRSFIAPTPVSLWKHAQEIAKQKLPEDEWAHLSPSPEDTVAAALNAAEEAHKRAKEKRWSYIDKTGKKIFVVERVGRVLKIFEKYAVVVDTAIQHNPDITALVWGATRFILQVSSLRRWFDCAFVEHWIDLEKDCLQPYRSS